MKRKGRLQALATQPPSHTATPQATEKEEKKGVQEQREIKAQRQRINGVI